jgi:hypothetical protein
LPEKIVDERVLSRAGRPQGEKVESLVLDSDRKFDRFDGTLLTDETRRIGQVQNRIKVKLR